MTSNIGAFPAKKRDRHEPLRSLNEMAEEFGVTSAKLKSLITHQGGPAPEMRHNASLSGRKTWYVPSAMRLWWKRIQRPNQ